MPWPVVDLLNVPPQLGSKWAYQSSVPTSDWSYRANAGSMLNPVRLDGSVVVSDLSYVDLGAVWKSGALAVRADVTAAASWNGPIGVASPRLGVAYATDRVLAQAVVTAPFRSFDDLVGAPHWSYDVSVSVGGDALRATAGSVYREFPTDWWQSSAYGAVGAFIGPVGVEARYEQNLKGHRWVEAGVSARVDRRCWRARPTVSAGLVDTIGSPTARVSLAVEYGCKPVEVEPVEVVIEEPSIISQVVEVPVAEPIADAIVVAPPVQVYETPRESIGGFLGANPSVVVYIRTNLSETQANRALSILQAKGLPMQQVERTEYAERAKDEPLYLDFIVIKGNKNTEANREAVEMVP